MDYGTLAIAREGWCLEVRLNRPEARNAMNGAMVRDLLDLFQALPKDTGLRAVVLRGSGGTFCAGGDLRDMAGAGEETGDPARLVADLNRGFGRMLEAAEAIPQFLVAAVEGAAMGGGFGLACVADTVVATESARFGLPEVTLGLIPAQIAPFVARRIGQPATRRLALLGGKLDGKAALELGLVDMLDDDLDAAVAATLETLKRCAPGAVAETKALLRRMEREPLPALLDHAAERFAAAALGREAANGIPAFLTRTAPPWAEEGA